MAYDENLSDRIRNTFNDNESILRKENDGKDWWGLSRRGIEENGMWRDEFHWLANEGIVFLGPTAIDPDSDLGHWIDFALEHDEKPSREKRDPATLVRDHEYSVFLSDFILTLSQI